MKGIEHVRNVCKVGQGEYCCRYLLATKIGFECGKMSSDMKLLLDTRVEAEMQIAISDNCEGKDMPFLNDHFNPKP